jgi:hypothetical protein
MQIIALINQKDRVEKTTPERLKILQIISSKRKEQYVSLNIYRGEKL